MLYVTVCVTRIQKQGNGSLKSYRTRLTHFRNIDLEKQSNIIIVVYRSHFDMITIDHS